MTIGNMLSNSEGQYVAKKDDKGTWRILDMWHDDVKNMDSDTEVPDDSPAVLCFTEGQFLALIKEAASQGILSNVNFSNDEELEAEINLKADVIKDLEKQLEDQRRKQTEIGESTSLKSEEAILKEKAMSSILKLAGMQDMTKLSRN
tara:strand:- start:10322 stop:10762 length:441 start_codon:yes stop_codon:yes gene_type:complete